MDPSVTIASVNLPTPKMKILATSPVAPIHRKAKLLTRCPLRGAVAAANPLALLLMVEDEMRYGAENDRRSLVLVQPFSLKSES